MYIGQPQNQTYSWQNNTAAAWVIWTIGWDGNTSLSTYKDENKKYSSTSVTDNFEQL
jgi:predicted DNA-binding protein with PD1-like motif